MILKDSSEALERPDSMPVSPLILQAGVVLVSFILYMSTLSKHFSEGEDSAWYVQDVTAPSSVVELFHPNHLLYNAVNHLIYKLCQFVGYQGNACLPMQVTNAAAGALALGLMLRILGRLNVESRLALAWVGVTAVCYGFWSYSVQPEIYLMPLPPLLICIDQLIKLSDGRFSYKTFALIGFFGAIATLLHQQHVLALVAFTIAAAVIGFSCRSEDSIGRVLIGMVILCLTAAVLVGVPYLTVAIGVNGLRDVEAIASWSKGHGRNGMWVPWSNRNFLKSFVGFGRTVVGGHFLFGVSAFNQFVSRVFPKNLMIEERFIGQHLPVATLVCCLIASLTAFLSTLAVIGSMLFPVQTESKSPRRSQSAFIVISLLIVEYYLFNTMWEPMNIEYWIVLIPVVGIAIALLQSHRPGARRMWFAVAILMLSLFVANGLGSILPQTRRDMDYWYQANRYLIENAKPGDIVITDDGWICRQYLKMFSDADVIGVRTNANDRVPQVLEDRSGLHRVWISSWALEMRRNFESPLSKKMSSTEEKELSALLDSVAGRMVLRDDGPFQAIWELLPEAE